MILEESIPNFNAKFPIPMDFTLAYGPLAYLHILHIKNPLRKFDRKDLWHFLPAVLLDGVFFFATRSYIGSNLSWAKDHSSLILTIAAIVITFGIIQLTFYTYFIYKEFRDTKQILKEFIKVKNWVTYLLIAWCLIIIFLVIIIPIVLIFSDDFENIKHYVYKPLCTILALLIYLIGYSYLMKYHLVIKRYMNKVKKFKFTHIELEEKKKMVLSMIEENKLFKDHQLNIAKLAGHLGWPINNLSIILNDVLKTNFNDLINKYRIEHFKQIISTTGGKKYSIVGLAHEVGFSSKASFYRAFKKETGLTPTEFINSKD
jgi:AraC-like DNA-binding protein